MRTRSASIFLAAALAASACATAPARPTSTSASEGPTLESVIDAVKAALLEAESSETPGLPPLKSVSVKLQASAARSAGGELRLFVFSAGSSVSTQEVSTIEIELVPPGTGRNLITTEVRDALARAIVAARSAAAHAARGEPPMSVKTVNVDLRFAVSVDGSAGGSVRLVPAGLDISGKISRDSVHTVSLVFGR